MTTLARIALMLIASLAMAANDYGGQEPAHTVCTEKDAKQADHDLDFLKNWEPFYRSFKNVGQCDSGYISEGHNDGVVELLAKNWGNIDEFIRFANDDLVFERFVLRHVDETADYNDFMAAADDPRTLCTASQEHSCKQVEEHVRGATYSLNRGVAPILGILEDNPGRHAGDPNFRAVRALFTWTDGEWKPFRTGCRDEDCLRAAAAEYPQEVTWTVAFDGKNVGQVTTRAPKQFQHYADMGLEEITSSHAVPAVGKPSPMFAGFAGGEVYRPLVAVSAPNFVDPEGWKPAQLTQELRTAFRKEFRRKFPKASNCRNPDENKIRPWVYRDEDIKIGKEYSSTENWSLAQLNLTGWRCDGPEEDAGPFISQWFVADPDGTIRFLDRGMWLVDAGDYDNDGRSEIVFSVGRYDAGGYEIFYDDFKKHAIFTYIFH